MSDAAVSEARSRLGELIDQARATGEPVYVSRRGKRVAAIVDSGVLERMVAALEDQLDHAELGAAREEDDYVPWDEVKVDLGLT